MAARRTLGLLRQRERGRDQDGYRSEAVFERLKAHPTELIVALGREGKQQVEIDANQYPYTTDMAAKLQTEEGRIVDARAEIVQQIASPPWMPDQVRHDKTFCRAD